MDGGALPRDGGSLRRDANYVADASEPSSVSRDAGEDGALGASADGAVSDAEAPEQTVLPLDLHVESGDLQGMRSYGARAFLGVPYAAPPVGDKRFARPEPAAPWRGARQATEVGRPCIQSPGDVEGPYSEDCLTLNIYTPDHPHDRPWPVMVYIHGGGNVFGSGNNYRAEWLAVPHDVVVVTINYRLSALGNLVSPALGDGSGNLGLRDQIRALQWTRANIAAFGGDPENVTVFGESYGGASACMLMMVHAARELAQRFIMESVVCFPGGVSDADPHTKAEATSFSQRLIDRICPGRSDVAACLRAAPAEAFAATSAEVLDWRPHIDGDLILMSPSEYLAAGDWHPGAVIVGTNAHEWRTFTDLGAPRAFNRLEMQLWTTLLYPQDAEELLKEYLPEHDADVASAFLSMQTDGQFRCTVMGFVRAAAAAGNDVYVYRFDVAPAAHALELDYVFGWPSGGVATKYPGEAPMPSQPDVVAAMQRYWTAFARGDDPNEPGLPVWPVYREHEGARVLFRSPLSIDHLSDDRRCELWERIRAHQGK